MPVITYISVCTAKRLIARGVYELTCTKPAGFSFKAGQFILFSVPLIDDPSDVQTRAFSIASSPDENHLLFVAKMVEGGRASRWIAETITEGTTVTFTGPYGNFVLDRFTEKDWLFIATGTGIAPFRSMILHALTRRARGTPPSPIAMGEGRVPRIDLIFGVKSEADLFWTEWLEEISAVHANIFHHVTLSQPSASWTGHRGRVQTMAPSVAQHDFSRKSLYACGSPAMCKDVKALALGEWGMEKKDVHVEGYI